LGQLDAPAIEERAARDEHGIGPLTAHHFKSSIDLIAGVGVVDLNLQSDGTSSRLNIFRFNLVGRAIGRIDEHSDATGLR